MDCEVDVLSLGESDDRTSQGSVVEGEPLNQAEVFSFLDSRPKRAISLVLLDGDDVAGLDDVRGDIDGLAVDGDVTVVDDLTSHSS